MFWGPFIFIPLLEYIRGIALMLGEFLFWISNFVVIGSKSLELLRRFQQKHMIFNISPPPGSATSTLRAQTTKARSIGWFCLWCATCASILFWRLGDLVLYFGGKLRRLGRHFVIVLDDFHKMFSIFNTFVQIPRSQPVGSILLSGDAF